MPLLEGSPPGLLASLHIFCLSIAPQILVGQKFLQMEKQVIITCCKIRTVWRMLENFPVELFNNVRCHLD